MGVSIVTVNLNNKSGLFKTIESVFNQNDKNWNHFIVDAKSLDMELNDWIDIENKNISYISEKDNGVYDGMNKGVNLTCGDYLYFLNSGDTLLNSYSLNSLAFHIPFYDIIYGNVNLIVGETSKIYTYPENITLDYMLIYGLPHQATLIKRSLFDRIGGYSTDYKIISDWVFFMEALFYQNATYKHVDTQIADFNGEGMSQQDGNVKLIIKEQIDYISKRFPTKLKYYKFNSPYVKKHFRRMPRWQRFIKRFFFNQFNIV